MERITSRKNRIITHIRKLANDRAYRAESRQFVCDGGKLLGEALSAGAEIAAVLWNEADTTARDIAGAECYTVSGELIDYASPLKNSPGPVFAVKMAEYSPKKDESIVVLETVQDPGNVGTVIRTASALGIDRVLLCGGCADLYNPKTVRATMGAIFRQCVQETDLTSLSQLGVPLYGAALSPKAGDIRSLKLDAGPCAVAIGSEGRGLSQELLKLCCGEMIIPMVPGNESLNAAVAAAIVMWEMSRGKLRQQNL